MSAKRTRADILSAVQFQNYLTAAALEEKLPTNVAQPDFNGSFMEIDSPVEHSVLDFFEKPSVFIK